MIISAPSVTIGRRVKRISLQRFLLAKICYETDKVDGRDIVALYYNQLWLESKCLSDRQFSSKFNLMVGPLGELLSTADLTDRSKVLTFRSTIIKRLQAYIVPERNYAQWKSKFAGSYELVQPKASGTETKKLPQQRYIGIGYRDKGTAKNPAEDGSPSWQEVAVSAENRRLKIDEIQEAIQHAKDIDELVGILTDLDDRESSS